MKKDIYIIKNDINNKVYIGQAINSNERFKEHCRLSEISTYFDKEINAIGREHFWYEILESQVENYDEREIYWINYYNALYPNGYNIAPGGSGVLNGTKSLAATIKDEQILDNIINDLKNTKLLYSEIAKKYNILNDNIICRINTGACYKKDNINYPIRPQRVDNLLTNDELIAIKNLLKNSCLSFYEIAKQYNISQSTIRDINVGKIKKDDNENYPIRKGIITKNSLTDKEVNEIYNFLINTKLSIRKISQMYNRDFSVINGIKNGTTKAYRKEGYKYPLRKNDFKKPVSTISAKESTVTIDT